MWRKISRLPAPVRFFWRSLPSAKLVISSSRSSGGKVFPKIFLRTRGGGQQQPRSEPFQRLGFLGFVLELFALFFLSTTRFRVCRAQASGAFFASTIVRLRSNGASHGCRYAAS